MGNEEKLSSKEKVDLAIEAGIGSIPYIGGAIQTLYYGSKNEKRFKRIENFYNVLHDELESIKEHLPTKTKFVDDRAIGLLETINDEVEKASSQHKLNNYKNAFKNILLNLDKTSFEHEQYFLKLLSELTELEIKILYVSSQKENKKVETKDFRSDYDSGLILGSKNRLVDFGLITKFITGHTTDGFGSTEIATLTVNELGSGFISFIFE